jgi:hypothetical protein
MFAIQYMLTYRDSFDFRAIQLLEHVTHPSSEMKSPEISLLHDVDIPSYPDNLLA